MEDTKLDCEQAEAERQKMDREPNAPRLENAKERVQQFIANQIEFEQIRYEKLAEIMMHEDLGSF